MLINPHLNPPHVKMSQKRTDITKSSYLCNEFNFVIITYLQWHQ